MLKVYKGVFKSDWKEIVDVEMRKNHMYKIILYVIAFQFIFINLRMKMFCTVGPFESGFSQGPPLKREVPLPMADSC